MIAPSTAQQGEVPGRKRACGEFCTPRLGALVVALLLCRVGLAQTGGAGLPTPPQPAGAREQRIKERDIYDAQTARFRAEGKRTEAIAAAEKMLAIEREVFGDVHADVAGSLRLLRELHEACEHWEAARKAGREFLAIQIALHGDKSWLAADARLALAHVDRMAALDPPARQRLAEAIRGLGLADQYSERTDYAHAEPLLRQIVETAKEILGEEDLLYAHSLNNLGVLCQDTGDYAQAARLFREGLLVQRKLRGEMHPTCALMLHNLGDVYADAGDLAQAEPLLRRSLEMIQKTIGPEDPLYVQNLANLAKVSQRKEDYAAAEDFYRTALGILKRTQGEQSPIYATQLKNLATLYCDMGDYAKAEQLIRRGSDVAKQTGQQDWPVPGVTAAQQGDLYFAMGNYAQAETALGESLEIARRHLELTCTVQSERRQLVQAQFLRGRLDQYLSLALRAGMAGEHTYQKMLAWKGIVFARQRWLRLQRTRAATNPETARLITDLQKTIVQLANLAFAKPEPEEQEARARHIRELTERKEQLESLLARQSADYRGLQALTAQTPARLQAALPVGAALIDFLEYKDSSPPPGGKGKVRREQHVIAFVVRRDRPIVARDLGPVVPLAAAIDRWRSTLTASTPPADPEEADPAAELRRLVWQPLTPYLDGVSAVFYSPDGALNRFPFAALPGTKPETYLIEEMPIAVVPVPQLLPELLARHREGAVAGQQADSLFVMGDVDFGAVPGHPPAVQNPGTLEGYAAARGGHGLQFLPLSGTVGETDAIQTEFARSHPQGTLSVLRGAAASEEAFRRQAPGKKYLHVATHGFFAPSELKSALETRSVNLAGLDNTAGFHPGLLSGLALAGANRGPPASSAGLPPGDDGILTALEVAEMDLSSAELVVLSACDTGLGRAAGGEGLLGLQRAFQIAGARAVIASLWKVDDEVTQHLMRNFYNNLWQQRRTPLQALRQAQLSILNGEALVSRPRGLGPAEPGPVVGQRARVDPRLWAAWVLSGDPGDLAPQPSDASRTPISGASAGPPPIVVVERPTTDVYSWLWYGVAGLLLGLILLGGLLTYRVRRRPSG